MNLSEFINTFFGTSSNQKPSDEDRGYPGKQFYHSFDDHFVMFPRMFSSPFFHDEKYDARERYKGGSLDYEMDNMFRETDEIINSITGRYGIMDDTWSSRFGHDRMIRWPEDDHLDTDIDDMVKKNGIKSLMAPMTGGRVIPIDDFETKNKQDGRVGSSDGFFQAKMYSKAMTGDGRVQEVKKYKDSQGNHFESKSRTVDGKTYAVIDKKTASGEEEHLENFYNMDGGDVDDFERRWNDRRERMKELLPGSVAKAITDTGVTYDDHTRYGNKDGKEGKKGILDYFKHNFLKD